MDSIAFAQPAMGRRCFVGSAASPFLAHQSTSPARRSRVRRFARVPAGVRRAAPNRPRSTPMASQAYERVSPLSDGNDEEPVATPDVRRLAALFWRLAMPYWKRSPEARRDLAGVVALTLLQSGISVGFSYISRDFWTALNTKDMELFLRQAGFFFAALTVFTPIVVYYQYYRDRCALKWRDWLTRTILDQYVAKRNFYSLDQDAAVDNPDQRIAQDLSSFTYESLSLMLTVLVSAVDLVSFSAILYSIYPPLFGVLVVYAATGTALTTAVGRRLVGLNYSQLVKEADFRYSLIRFRDNAESIAFFRGERREQAEITRRLEDVVGNLINLIGLQRQLGFLQTGYRYLIQILPSVVVAPLYFKDQIQLGAVTQSFSAFSHILNDLSLIVNRFDQLSQFGAGIERLGEFVEALEENLDEKDRTFGTVEGKPLTHFAVSGTNGEAPAENGAYKAEKSGAISENGAEALDNGVTTVSGNGVAKSGNGVPAPQSTVIYSGGEAAAAVPKLQASAIELQETESNGLVVQDLTLSTPSGGVPRELISELSFRLTAGQRLLVAGPSGVGKSSLLRAIAGLWNNGSGVIERPGGSRVFFLPQRPYCTLGTLRANMLYPRDDACDGSAPSDSELLRVLGMVDLHALPERMGGFDATRDWGDTLSLGEQQRLQFARLLLAKPALAVIDEGSAALSIDAEGRMYGLLQSMGITVVSIGHRPSLLKYHDVLLRLGGEERTWELDDIKQEQRDRVVAQTL